MRRPLPTEYDPFYSTYVDKVPEGEVLDRLAESLERTLALLRGCPESRERYRYAEGKWSLREVVGHMVDVERLFAFRALHFARGDGAPLPGMDQDLWAAASNAAERPLAELLEELATARRSSIALFRGFDAEQLECTGEASGCRFTVRAVAYILAGHEIHHRRVLAERYLAGDPPG